MIQLTSDKVGFIILFGRILDIVSMDGYTSLESGAYAIFTMSTGTSGQYRSFCNLKRFDLETRLRD